jgi:hypothetical protein
MGLFSSKSKTLSCFFCSAEVEKPTIMDHYRVHLIPVTDNDGQQAYTFECPRCGAMDLAWGGGRPNPMSNATSAMGVHLMERHGIPLF